MRNATQAAAGMEIKTIMDASHYVGKIVAIETNISAFVDGMQWEREGSPKMSFGYVKGWDGFIRGAGVGAPSIYMVLFPGSISRLRTISSEALQSAGGDGRPGFLKMREATPEEIADIKKAVQKSKAELEFDANEFRKALDMTNAMPAQKFSNAQAETTTVHPKLKTQRQLNVPKPVKKLARLVLKFGKH